MFANDVKNIEKQKKNTVRNVVVAFLAALTQLLALKKKMLFGYY